MKRSVNNIVSKELDNFLIRENTGSIKKTEFGYETELFKNLEERKHVLGYLVQKGLDPFKRGTKEPARIIQALSVATWPEVKLAPQVGRSMWD